MKNQYTFTTLKETSRLYGENNDCVVKAIVLVTGFSYEKVHNYLRLKGRKFGKVTMRTLWKGLLPDFGVKITPVRFIGKTPKTLRILHPEYPHLILSSGHVAAFVGGSIQDWSKGRQTRIKDVWKVELGEPDNQFLNTPEMVVKGLVKTSKPRSKNVLWELRLNEYDEYGSIVDYEVIAEYFRKPARKIRNIKHTYMIGRPETVGKMSVYSLASGDEYK